MKKFTSLFLLFIGLSGFSQIALTYQLKKEQFFKIVTVADQTIEQNIAGTIAEVKQKITMGISYEVVSATKELFDIKCTYYRIAYATSAMGIEVNYDSENPNQEVEPGAVAFAALLDKSFFIKINTSGAVLEVSGFDEIIDAMMEDFGELDEATRSATREQFKLQFGDEQITKTMEQSLKFFPISGKAKKNEKWSISSTLGMFEVDIKSDYELSGYDQKSATISVWSEIAPSSFKQNAGGVDMEMEMSGSQSGEYIIERSTGMLISGRIVQDLTASAKTMGMTIPMKINAENTFVRVD